MGFERANWFAKYLDFATNLVQMSQLSTKAFHLGLDLLYYLIMLDVAILKIWTSTLSILFKNMPLLLVDCLLLTLDLFTTWRTRIAARNLTIFWLALFLHVMKPSYKEEVKLVAGRLCLLFLSSIRKCGTYPSLGKVWGTFLICL